MFLNKLGLLWGKPEVSSAQRRTVTSQGTSQPNRNPPSGAHHAPYVLLPGADLVTGRTNQFGVKVGIRVAFRAEDQHP